MKTYEKPLPMINEDNEDYWQFCKKHELRMQKCEDCGFIRFPASIICPKCHSMKFTWEQMSGKGKIYSFIVFRRAYLPSYENDIPYVVAIIQLDEGPRLESNIIGCSIDDVEIDMEVQVEFEDITQDISLPKFKAIK